MTPAMEQYYDIKKDFLDSILFFRMGDFYEMFGNDAIIAHKVLGIAITSRNKNATDPIELAGIPYHSKDKYLPLLVEAGYKVAIAEQVSDPKLKGIVKREVVRVVTPSTLNLEGEGYEKKNISNYILSIVGENSRFAISFLDLIQGKWMTSEFDDLLNLKSEIYKISPTEVVLDKNLFNNEELKETLSKKYSLNIYYFSSILNYKEKLLNHFGTKNLEGYGLENRILAQKSSSLLLEYLETNQKTNFSFLDTISYQNFGNYLELDEATIKSLDLIYNFSTKSNIVGTLFGVMNKTLTNMGTRYLRDQLLKPLKDKIEIEKRQSFIEELYKDKILLDKIREKLKYVADIDNILIRLTLNRALPKDLLNLKRSLLSIVEIYNIFDKSDNKILKKIFLD